MWKENVEGNTEKETEEEDGLKQVRGSNSEQGGNAFHWKKNSVLVVHGANEVFQLWYMKEVPKT